MDNNKLPLTDVFCRIQMAETVLSLWLKTLTSDDGNVPDMVGVIITLLDGLANSIALHDE